jgi:hypothetical protein
MYSLRMRVPTKMLCSGSSTAASPPTGSSLSRCHIGMICIRPLAPATLSATGLKPDSTVITARMSSGSSSTSREASRTRSITAPVRSGSMRWRRERNSMRARSSRALGFSACATCSDGTCTGGRERAASATTSPLPDTMYNAAASEARARQWSYAVMPRRMLGRHRARHNHRCSEFSVATTRAAVGGLLQLCQRAPVTVTCMLPIFSICATITSPALTGPTPSGVPVRSTSPGCSV